jgi:hypothetical protein
MHSLLMARINDNPPRVDAESCHRHSVIVFNFEKRDVSRVSEGDQQFSPAGVLLQERFSA